MQRQQLLFLVVVGAGAALLGVLTAPLLAPDPPPEAEPDPAPGAAPAPPAAAPAPDGPVISRTASIPRPERRARPADGARATQAGGGGAGSAAGEAGDDTAAPFGQVDPDRDFTPDEIQATVATFKGDIEACLDDWGPQIEGFDGRLVLQADFSPDGVEDVRVVDLDNVPLQLLGCFSTPVWEATWPQPDGAVTISYPFVVEVPDEAPEDDAPEEAAPPQE